MNIIMQLFCWLLEIKTQTRTYRQRISYPSTWFDLAHHRPLRTSLVNHFGKLSVNSSRIEENAPRHPPSARVTGLNIIDFRSSRGGGKYGVLRIAYVG